MPQTKRTPTQLYLFDEDAVTWPQVWDWVESVAGIPRTSWRAAYYAKHWNVADKIRAARLSLQPRAR